MHSEIIKTRTIAGILLAERINPFPTNGLYVCEKWEFAQKATETRGFFSDQLLYISFSMRMKVSSTNSAEPSTNTAVSTS